MRLGRIIDEVRIAGNRSRRETEGLPWLEYRADEKDIGEAIADAEKVTGRIIRVGLWSNRQVPGDVIIIGKYVGDPDEPELPLCTVRGATLPEADKALPALLSRARSTERVLAKLAIRLIRLEKKVSFYRLLTLIALIGLIGVVWILAFIAYQR